MAKPDPQKDRNVWVASVRPDGRPHLVPVWFVVADGKWYITTAPGSVKARNLQASAKIALALENGDNPYVVEGEAQAVKPSKEVVRLFKEKYDWNIETDAYYTQTFEVVVRKKV
ncbi:MAG: pyridoxamine 5'-phosphate oxidase family protein [Chloroflexi bacterium]|nr:pyridoxamine 5'-phosphate oxidase family protein [Chloroflexota bacterium]